MRQQSEDVDTGGGVAALYRETSKSSATDRPTPTKQVSEELSSSGSFDHSAEAPREKVKPDRFSYPGCKIFSLYVLKCFFVHSVCPAF